MGNAKLQGRQLGEKNGEGGAAMTIDQFETLVRKLERSAKERPQGYRVQVGALAALGYVYIFGIVLLLLALVAGLIGGGAFVVYWMATHPGTGAGAVGAVKLLIPVGIGLTALIGIVFRSFQVHFPEPDGIPLERGQAPRLFATLDEICDTLHAPRFHHVLITDDFNAGVYQYPRLGLLGGHVNYLMLGLPLMEAFSPAHLRAVLAHEIGHLSGNHNRFSGQISRIRKTWDQMLATLQAERHGGISLFLPFFRWYAPYFAAYSFVLRRGNEYVADRCAAEVVGKETAAQTLILSKLKGRAYEQEFWGKLLEKARTEPQVPQDLYSHLQTGLRSGSERDAMTYEDALEERTDLADTHPSLSDRLAALGYRTIPGGPLDLPKPPLPLPPPITETAADFYLGSQRERLAAPFNDKWRSEIADAWVKQNQRARLQEQKLDELEAKVHAGTLTLEEGWERAKLMAAVGGEGAALPLLHEFLKFKPDHAEANFVFGKLLLERKDGRGLPYLQKAMKADPEAVGAGSETISWFLRGQGRDKEAAAYRERGRAHQRDWDAGQAERATVGPDDKFLYHGLTADEAAKFRQELAQFGEIWRVYLVRKQVRYFPEKPLYVLGIVPSASAGPDMIQKISSQIKFPGETFLIVLQGNGKKMEKPLAQLSTALLFSR